MIGAFNKKIAYRYPWSADASRYVADSDIKLADLNEDSGEVKYAARRLKASLKPFSDELVLDREISESPFAPYVIPITNLILSIIGDMRLTNRWAVNEAKITQANLLNEAPETIRKIVTDKFSWEAYYLVVKDKSVLLKTAGMIYDWKLRFDNFLSANFSFHDVYWKLCNQILVSGYVLLTNQTFTRLISEKVKLELSSKKLRRIDLKELNKGFISVIEGINNEWMSFKKRLGIEEVQISGPVRREAFPPCIRELITKILSGENISHQGRFTVTSFLLNIGMSEDMVLDLFRSAPDFNEKLTKYQIEHIKGTGTGKAKYSPPSCKTLKTYSLCFNSDVVCEGISHPLKYYQRRKSVRENRPKNQDIPQK